MSTLAIVRKELQKLPEEVEQEYKDRTLEEAFHRLYRIQEKNEKQQKEYDELKEKWLAVKISQGGYLAINFSDKDMTQAVIRILEDINMTLGKKITPFQRILVDRLMIAIIDGMRYERMFSVARYKLNEDSSITWNETPDRIAYLREARRGKESADERILRLTQALTGSTTLHVQVKNAVIAQNMQINHDQPKDLEKITASKNEEDTK